jgi:hypothetical protein
VEAAMLFISPTDERRHLLPRLIDGPSGLLPKPVNARRIPKPDVEIGRHRLHHLRTSRCGGSMVQIYPAHLTLYYISDNRINPYSFTSHPGNSSFNIFYLPLQFKNYPTF